MPEALLSEEESWKDLVWGSELAPQEPLDFFGVFYVDDECPRPVAVFADEQDAHDWNASHDGDMTVIVCRGINSGRIWNNGLDPVPEKK